MKLPRNDDGTLPAYAWPGGYPIVYYDSTGIVLCPKCANKYDQDNEALVSMKPHEYEIHWEGEPLSCDECFVEIESAYGMPEEN